jgi:branched-chain amino acid transport system substrate-binding protein
LRCPATVPSSTLRRLRALAVPLLLALTLAACQDTNLFQRSPPVQGAPAAPTPIQPATPAAPEAPPASAPPVTVQPEGPVPPAGTPAEAGEAAKASVKVALLLPLSGPNAALGKAMLNAAELAVFDVADDRFQLLPRDTAGTADGAQRAARAVLDEGAKLVLGPFFAAEVNAVAPLTRSAGVNLLAFSTDERVAGQGVFLMGFLPRTQVTRVVSFAHLRGLDRFAAVVPDSPYGQAIEALLREAVVQAGATVADIESYDPAAGNATQVVRQLANYESRRSALLAQRKELEGKTDDVSRQALQRLQSEDALGAVGFDTIMLPEGGERLLALAPLLPYYDIDPARVRLLGTGLWDDPRLGKEPALIGGWYAAPDPHGRAAFEQRYAKLFGGAPLRIATLGYDATALAAVLARAKDGPDFSVQALTNPNGFAGLDGIFRLRADGLNERGLAVLEVQRDGPRIVSPAPTSFATE